MTAAVLKPGDAARMFPAMTPLDLTDVQRQADAIRAAAQAELDAARRRGVELQREAVEAARGKLAAAMEQARRVGFERGRAEGLETGRSAGRAEALEEGRREFARRIAPAASAAAALAELWQREHRRLFLEARLDVAALAIAAVRRIAPRLAELDPGTAEASCRAALASIGKLRQVAVYLHPDDLETTRQLAESPQAAPLGIETVDWRADPRVDRGGARLEFAGGSIDARIETQVQRIADDLLDGWRERLAALGLESVVAPASSR